jgi:predicted nucleic acid-binding protein
LGVDRDRLAAGIAKGSVLLLDTSVLIAYLEGGREITEAATLLIDDWVQSGRNRAFVSAISAMELLVAPLRARRATDEHLDFLQRFPNVECISVDIAAAEQAASVRAHYGIKPPDALIIGTAVALGAEAIVTNDSAWLKVSPKPVVLLSDYV